jgi:hypothetical protein
MRKSSVTNVLIVLAIVVGLALVLHFYGAELKHWFLAMHGRR